MEQAHAMCNLSHDHKQTAAWKNSEPPMLAEPAESDFYSLSVAMEDGG